MVVGGKVRDGKVQAVASRALLALVHPFSAAETSVVAHVFFSTDDGSVSRIAARAVASASSALFQRLHWQAWR
jgi:hypothetical protein